MPQILGAKPKTRLI